MIIRYFGKFFGKKYPKWKPDTGAEMLEDIKILKETNVLKYAGQGSIKEGQPIMKIYRGEGMTVI